MSVSAVRLFSGETFQIPAGIVQFTGVQVYWIDEDGNDHLSRKFSAASGSVAQDVKTTGGDRVGQVK